MAKNTAIVKAADYDLDEKKAKEIQASFEPMMVERKVLAKEYEAIRKLDVDADVCKRAGTLRKALVKVRTGIDGVHKVQKHLFLMAGRFVDAWKNAETLPVTQMEEKLRDIEEHFENIEKERIAVIECARGDELYQYGVAPVPAGLGQMDDDVWANYLAGVKESHRQAEKERIAQEKADAEECERLRIENEKLKKEAEGLAKKEVRERKAREAKEAKERKKREDAEAKAQAILKAERDAADAKLKIEREKHEHANRARIAKEARVAKVREAANAKAEAKLAVERAARERLEQEKEDRRCADQLEHEEKKAREKDTAHRKEVNNAIADALMAIDGLSRPACVKIVKALVKGDIPNVSVNY